MGWGYTPPGGGGGGGGVTVHGDLTGRDDADQHSIAAVTDLASAITAARLGYKNIMLYVADHDVTVALLTGTPDLFPADAGYYYYVYDGTSFSTLLSQGAGLVLQETSIGTEDGDAWSGKIWVNGSTGDISNQFRWWYSGMDSGGAAPHYITLMGQRRSTDNSIIAYDRDIVIFTDLTDDEVLTIQPNHDATMGTLEVYRLDRGEFSLTLNGLTVNGNAAAEIPLGYSRCVYDAGSGNGTWVERDATGILELRKQDTIPTVTANVGAGTGGVVTLHSSSCDSAGTISVNTGTGCTTGVIANVEFWRSNNFPLASVFPVISLTPTNSAAAQAVVSVNTSGTGWFLDAVTALNDSVDSYTWFYTVVFVSNEV